MGKKLGEIICCVVVLSFISGCGGGSRTRLGCYATSTPGTRFTSLNKLGNHASSGFGFGEGNGIVYTCHGGHIDITHLRLVADYTKEVYDKAYNCISKGRSEFTFKLPVEPTIHCVQFTYPKNWNSLPQTEKERIAKTTCSHLVSSSVGSSSTSNQWL